MADNFHPDIKIFSDENISLAEKIVTVIQYLIGLSAIALILLQFINAYETFYIFTPLLIIFWLINAWLNNKRNRSYKKDLILAEIFLFGLVIGAIL